MELALGQRRWLAPLWVSFAGVALLFTLIGLDRVIAYFGGITDPRDQHPVWAGSATPPTFFGNQVLV